ncbi:50S ribosomal protein L3 [bacterium]|nr:50S ribosomal protein L3 [bacterium]
MIEGLLAKKVGMVQLFDKEGRAIGGTIMEAGPCTVVQVKSDKPGNYGSVQLGFGDVDESRLTKPLAGHFSKASVAPKRHLKEVRIESGDEYKVGQEIRVDLFSVGQRVDVTGVSKGKGFAGVVKRWNMRGGPKSHGSTFHRQPGSIGCSASPGRVLKGKKLPGHAGNRRVTALNLEVLLVRPEENLLLVKGCVPGPPKGLLFVRRSVKQKVKKEE